MVQAQEWHAELAAIIAHDLGSLGPCPAAVVTAFGAAAGQLEACLRTVQAAQGLHQVSESLSCEGLEWSGVGWGVGRHYCT